MLPKYNSPCYKCPDRKIVDGHRCHSFCEKWAQSKAAHDEIVKKALEEMTRDSLLTSFRESTFHRRAGKKQAQV